VSIKAVAGEVWTADFGTVGCGSVFPLHAAEGVVVDEVGPDTSEAVGVVKLDADVVVNGQDDGVGGDEELLRLLRRVVLRGPGRAGAGGLQMARRISGLFQPVRLLPLALTNISRKVLGRCSRPPSCCGTFGSRGLSWRRDRSSTPV
jgi:hypothetical protein